MLPPFQIWAWTQAAACEPTDLGPVFQAPRKVRGAGPFWVVCVKDKAETTANFGGPRILRQARGSWVFQKYLWGIRHLKPPFTGSITLMSFVQARNECVSTCATALGFGEEDLQVALWAHTRNPVPHFWGWVSCVFHGRGGRRGDKRLLCP